MIIGYSCWGFLGNGIEDTPDGGRSHRLPLIKALIEKNNSIILLQKNRDLLEAGEDFSSNTLKFHEGFPDIDVLFLEYRWKIVGRNYGVDKNSSGYTPDYERQEELIAYYKKLGKLILIWDKDQKITDDTIFSSHNCKILDPALFPRLDHISVLFPMDDVKTKQCISGMKDFDLVKKKKELVYIGNQYERDGEFSNFIDTPAKYLDSETYVYGNWTKYSSIYEINKEKFPNVDFKGRLGFSGIWDVYEQTLTTVLIAPDRYYQRGQFTQRLFESLWGYCIPLIPNSYVGIEQVAVDDLVVNDYKDVLDCIAYIRGLDKRGFSDLWKRQVKKALKMFSAKNQVNKILDTIKHFYEDGGFIQKRS